MQQKNSKIKFNIIKKCELYFKIFKFEIINVKNIEKIIFF